MSSIIPNHLIVKCNTLYVHFSPHGYEMSKTNDGLNELYDQAKRQSDHYNRDIGITFGAQLLSFRACFRAEIAQQSSVSQLAKILIVDYHSVKFTFAEVCTALLLFLTVATAERSFSKLKLIKTYLRSRRG